MSKINWDEYKEYKYANENLKGLDNFAILLEFLRSFYNKTSPFEVYDMLQTDAIGQMMLEKREIRKPENLEDYLNKRLLR